MPSSCSGFRSPRLPARRAVARAMARYASRISPAEPPSYSRRAPAWAATVPASPRATGPVRADSPEASAFSRVARSSGPSIRSGASTPTSRSSCEACATSVTMWFEPCARAAWYRTRSASAIATGSAPISTTSAWAIGSIAASAVTPKVQSRSLVRSRLMPVNVMAGCSASGTAPAARTGCRIPTPKRPEVCATSWPGCQAPSLASPFTSGPRASSGTASRTSSARSTMSCTSKIGTPGRSVSTRSLLASETADAPMTACSAPRSAAPRTAPTFPAPMIPTPRRPGLAMMRAFLGIFCGWGGRLGRGLQPVFTLLVLARGPGAGRLGIEQGTGFVEAGLDEPRGHRTRRGVQDQVRHPEPPGERALLERHGLGALVRHHHEVPPPAARPQEQGGLRRREAVAPPAQRRQEPGPARAGDEAAVGVLPSCAVRGPGRVSEAGDPRGEQPHRVLGPGIREHQGEDFHDVAEVSHRKQRGPGRPFAGAVGQAVAGHVDLDPVPAEYPPQRRLADLQRLDPAGRHSLRLRVQQAVAQPDAVRGNGSREVVALVERGPVGGDER